MIVLPRTRGFSAGTWPITPNSQPKCDPVMACTWRLCSLARSRQVGPFRQSSFHTEWIRKRDGLRRCNGVASGPHRLLKGQVVCNRKTRLVDEFLK